MSRARSDFGIKSFKYEQIFNINNFTFLKELKKE